MQCKICDWPIHDSIDNGCTADSCSYRPFEGTKEYFRIERRKANLKKHPDLECPFWTTKAIVMKLSDCTCAVR
jgi:hypothetical protein